MLFGRRQRPGLQQSAHLWIVDSAKHLAGVWRSYNLSKSKLEIEPPAASTFWIDHREPVFHLKRTHVYAGEHSTWGIDLATDGKEVVQQHSAAAWCRWTDELLSSMNSSDSR